MTAAFVENGLTELWTANQKDFEIFESFDLLKYQTAFSKILATGYGASEAPPQGTEEADRRGVAEQPVRVILPAVAQITKVNIKDILLRS